MSRKASDGKSLKKHGRVDENGAGEKLSTRGPASPHEEDEARWEAFSESSFDGIVVADELGRILSWNRAMERITGISAREARDRFLWDVQSSLASEENKISTSDLSARLRKMILDAIETGSAPWLDAATEYTIVRPNGETRVIQSLVFLIRAGCVRRIGSINRDITAMARVMEERDCVIELLRLMNEYHATGDLLHMLADKLRGWSGCEAVGIRLRDGHDYPYSETRGFPEEFVETERSLCVSCPDGSVDCDETGNPVLECMCGNIILGRFDPSKPFFTTHGSFWTNSTTDLLAGTTEADRQARTRNRCNGEGYESVALVPLRSGGETFGLFQFNDHRRNRFTRERIEFFERAADTIASSIYAHKAEEDLHASEARFRMIVEGSDDSILLSDVKGNYLYCNDSPLLGLSEAKIVGKTPREVFDPETASLLESMIAQVVDGGTGLTFTNRVEKNGEEFWFDTSLYPIMDEKGVVNAVGEISRNITGLRNAERALVASRERYHSLFESSRDPIGIFETGGKIIDVNQAWLEMFGYSREESLEMDIVDIYDNPADRARFFREIEGREFVKDFDVRYRRKNGSLIECLVTASTWRDSDGRMLGHLGIFRDVTERRRMDRKILEMKNFYETILENTVEGVCVCDRIDTVYYSNAGMERISGIGRDAILGRNVLSDFPERVIGNFRPYYLRAKESLANVYYDSVAVILPSGQSTLQSGWLIPLVKENAFDGMICTVHDVTEQKKLEQEVQNVRKLESVGVLAGGIAHNFNNILTAVIGNINLARMSVKNQPERNVLLTEAEAAAFKARDLTDMLITFAKGGRPVLRRTSIVPILRDAAEILCQEGPVRCAFEIQTNLMSPFIDERQIRQVVYSLVSNAREAMPGGGVVGISARNETVRAGGKELMKPGLYVIVSVHDTGIGIPPENMVRIFDPFFTTKEGRSGLSLASSYSIVRKHEGYLTVTSDPASGTEFVLHLPVNPSTEPAVGS